MSPSNHFSSSSLLWHILSLFALILQVSCQASLLASTGFTVTFNEIYYFVSPYEAGNVSVDVSTLSTSLSINGFYPVTVVQEDVTTSELAAVAQNFTVADDVFQEAFLQVVFLPNTATTTTTSIDGKTFTIFDLPSSSIPSGPYFLSASDGTLHQTYRLYPDYAGAFTEPLLQNPFDSTFSTLSAQIPNSATMTIGVPSRLYYTPTADKPLAGVRLAVKDIFDLAGVKTSNGNRAWYNLYPPATATGPALQRLIDAGAIIVGKQKPSQFANGEEATADWVDYHSPFNPRGDGYQDPSSSSSGAGASIGSYSWLDIAIGSDTGGSIRGPSEVQGLFGNRPSHGLVSLDNVMPLAPPLDTAGFLTRDPYLWGAAQAVLYESNYTTPLPTAYPTTVYTYEYPTNASESPSSAVLVNFIDKLTGFLSANTSALNLTTLWSTTGPSSVPLTTLLNITYPILIAQEQTRLLRAPFYADYAAAHDGRTPFVDPAPLARWAFGDSYPPDTVDQAIANKTLFQNWFNTEVLPRSSDPSICSEALFVYVGSTADADSINERNQYLSPPTAPYGFSSGRISVFCEAPDSVFPIGQASFFSNVTNHMEYLPVTVDILAAKGCDALLVKLAQDLAAAGIISIPEVGNTIYGGDVLMRRDYRAW